MRDKWTSSRTEEVEVEDDDKVYFAAVVVFSSWSSPYLFVSSCISFLLFFLFSLSFFATAAVATATAFAE